MPKQTFLTTLASSDKMLEMDLYLMHVEPIEILIDLRNQCGTKILWEKQFVSKKTNLGLRMKRRPVHQGSWTVPYQGWWEMSKIQEVLVGPL